jgi:hypothetical protein
MLVLISSPLFPAFSPSFDNLDLFYLVLLAFLNHNFTYAGMLFIAITWDTNFQEWVHSDHVFFSHKIPVLGVQLQLLFRMAKLRLGSWIHVPVFPNMKEKSIQMK